MESTSARRLPRDFATASLWVERARNERRLCADGYGADGSIAHGPLATISFGPRPISISRS